MTLFAILILIFIAVFIFLGWRIVTSKQPAANKPSMHVCPRCNEKDCDCYKQDNDN